MTLPRSPDQFPHSCPVLFLAQPKARGETISHRFSELISRLFCRWCDGMMAKSHFAGKLIYRVVAPRNYGVDDRSNIGTPRHSAGLFQARSKSSRFLDALHWILKSSLDYPVGGAA